MEYKINLDSVKEYYEKRIVEYGYSPLGVDWNSSLSQTNRFDQIIKVCNPDTPFSIIDYGCGYGALADYLIKKGFNINYHGFDIVEKAIEGARLHYTSEPKCTFYNNAIDLPVSDYVVASGIFNIRSNNSFDTWTEYVIQVLSKFNDLSIKGFASNFLTKYSDHESMRPDLYYADPCHLFDACKRLFSKNVALLHDYQLYDFTLIIRKD
ncbi:MAG TPA: class I SAM-dependent methyltransferase [Anaerolineales bacterium]|nr:class I SAM-dependent methyltransferase [Anaerolineales bacterium]